MGIREKKIFGIMTTVAIVGVTIYAIKKYYDSKKQDDKAIDLGEAKKIVEDGKQSLNDYGLDNVVVGSDGQVHYDPSLKQSADNIRYRLNKDETERVIGLNDEDMEGVKFDARDQAHYDPSFERSAGTRMIGSLIPGTKRKRNKSTLSDEQMEEIIDDARDQASYDSSFMDPNGIHFEKRTIGIKPEDVQTGYALEEEEEFDDPDPQEVQDSKGYYEEDKEVIDDLRYEHNSTEAREQFINMELANLGRDNDTRDVVAMLYDHPFVPTCDEDQNLKIRLVDHRIKFFGLVSRWTKEVTYGDVIMYYGKSAEFNCGENVRHWVDYFLTCADINNITLTSDEIDYRIHQLNAHNFFNDDLQSHSLFGLTSTQMTDAIVVARNRIDGKVTYDIEFHQFIQGVI